MTDQREIFVSVDVEAAGPIPGEFSLLSIGACVVDDKSLTFACELKPLNRNADPMALKVAGLSLETLERTGLAPEEAMKRFADWLKGLVYEDEVLVFVGFNAPFDWSFVNYYFHKFIGENPFGFSALDIKAYYMVQQLVDGPKLDQAAWLPHYNRSGSLITRPCMMLSTKRNYSGSSGRK